MRRKTLGDMLAEVAAARNDVEYVSGYTRPYEPATFRCKTCGYEWQVSPYCVIHGRLCPDCKRQGRVRKERAIQVDISNQLTQTDDACKVISANDMNLNNPYIAAIFAENPGFYFVGNPSKWTDDVTAVCRKCNTRMTYFASYFRTTTSCAHCGRKVGTSMLEYLILIAFKNKAQGYRVLHRDRSAIGLELDIYVPELHLAIEPGAWCFHASETVQANDMQKRIRCQNQGIKLITIYDSYTGANDIDSDTIWAYECCLSQERGLVTLKGVINRLLTLANLQNVAEKEWSGTVAEAQYATSIITQEEFATRVAARNASYEVVGNYTNKNTPVEIFCHRHNVRFFAYPKTLYNGSGCPECYKERTRISHDEFIRRVHDNNPDIIILDQYDGSNSSVHCQCAVDNHAWTANAWSLMQGHGCPECARRQTSARLRHAESDVIARLRKARPDVTYVSGYVRTHAKAKFRCNKCGNIWEVSPHNLFAGSACPQCAQASRVMLHTMSEEDFKQRIAMIYPGYEVVSPYIGYYDKVTVRCPEGHDHTLQATTFLNNQLLGTCPECRRNQSRDDIDAETLRKEYLDEELTIAQIGFRHNRSTCYVKKRLVDYGISIRPARKSVSIDQDILIRMYEKERKPMTEIEEFFGCSRPTIYKYMREYGIPKRRKGQTDGM